MVLFVKIVNVQNPLTIFAKYSITIYCMSYELHFGYKFRVTNYYTSYFLNTNFFIYEVRIIIYCTSYELLFRYK